MRRGNILRLKPDGSTTEVLTGLSKPDGQVMFRGGLVTGQEGGTLPVLWLHDGKSEALFEADNVEGIATDGHALFAIEDKTPGDCFATIPRPTSSVSFAKGSTKVKALAFARMGACFIPRRQRAGSNNGRPKELTQSLLRV